MPGIYIMAVITFVLSAAFWGAMIYLFAGRTRRFLWLVVPALPLSWIVNNYVKASVALVIGQTAGIPQRLGLARPVWFTFVLFMLTPVLEELTKAIPLLLPWARRLMQDAYAAFWTGMTLGLGFGLGEIFFVAWADAHVPAYAALPWYMLTGFLSERVMVCFAHGVMTSIFMLGLHRGGAWAAAGYLGAVSLHALLNAGPMLFQLGMLPMWVISLWEVAMFILAAYVFERLRRRVTAQRATVTAPGEVVYWTRPSP